jgi:tRNA U34 5-methylaminomethyl-2-thiouridine-forming methyltransferase MnmC
MSGLVKDRLRNQTVSFRVSPEERRQLEARIILSGMPKGQYFIQSLLHQELSIVVGKYQSDRLSLELRRLREQIVALRRSDNDELTNLLGDCIAILKQLQALIPCGTNDGLLPSDFKTVTHE